MCHIHYIETDTLCMLLSPGGFYDAERNLSALKLKCLSLALTRGCKANMHAKRGDPDVFVLQASRRKFSGVSSRQEDEPGG